MTIDTAAPGAPIITGFDDDTGTTGDGRTTDKPLQLGGTAMTGTTVTVKDGATVLGTAVANGAGEWNFTTGVLANAAHNFTATATDVAGNIASSVTLGVTVEQRLVYDLTFLTSGIGFVIRGDAEGDMAGFTSRLRGM